MKIIVEKAKSKTTEREYIWMYVDLGYTKKALSFKAPDIAEMLRISVEELMNTLKVVGDEIEFEANKI